VIKDLVFKEVELNIDKATMDQILVLKNPRFEKIFSVEDENLYEGLSTKMFEVYMFKKLNGEMDYEVLDSAD
jgi:hypothetical protein